MQRQQPSTTSTDALLSALLDMPELDITSKSFVMAEEKSDEILSEAVTLSTQLKFAGGQQASAVAKFCVRGGASKKAYVFASTAPNKSLGYVEYTLFPDEIYVDFIKNTSHLTMTLANPYKYVGNALHEIVFRESVNYGKLGYVSLYALMKSHVFHAENGFEPVKTDSVSAFKKKILKDKECYRRLRINNMLFDDDEDNLHLSGVTIAKKMQQFGLVFKTEPSCVPPIVDAISVVLPTASK